MSEAIGIEIRLEMARQGLTRTEMCQLASISRPTLNKIIKLEDPADYKDCKLLLGNLESVVAALNKKITFKMSKK